MGLLNVGISALNTAQMGLNTTQHNIANAQTPGYSRQIAQQTTNIPQLTGSGYLGQGSNVSTIQRQYSAFLVQQVQYSTSQVSYLDTYAQFGKQLDSVISDTVTGLSSSLQGLQNSIQSANSNPSDLASRQSVISSMQSLVSRFQDTQSRFNQIGNSTTLQLQSSLTNINLYATQIAQLNLAIQNAKASVGQPPNDLLDQRDQLVNQLSQEIGTTVINQPDGSADIIIGQGQSLVLGGKAFSLQLTASLTNPAQQDIAYQGPNNTLVRIKSSDMTPGKIGGALRFQNELLAQAQNKLGQLAYGLADQINIANKQGLTLNGSFGSDLFLLPTPLTITNGLNTGTGAWSVSISDSSAIIASDYNLAFNGTSYTLTRLSDNVQTALPTLPAVVDGLSINLSSGVPSANDTVLIQATRTAAFSLKPAAVTPADLALSSPVKVSGSVANLGSGSVGAIQNVGGLPLNANLSQPVSLTFNNPPTSFNVVGVGTGNPINVPYVAGSAISYNGWTFQLSGVPSTGDVFNVSVNTNGVSDSGNGIKMANLFQQNVLSGGTVSFMGLNNQMISQVAVQVQTLTVSSQSQTALLQQNNQSLQSVSGVNLDEEAANLMLFQKTYQAASKMIQIASTLFDNILAIK